jgi:hypothetical protein
MSSAPTLHRFVVFAPDKTDEGAFERRLSVRPKHLENAAKAINDPTAIRELYGFRLSLYFRILVRPIGGGGGALLSPESLTGAERKMVGNLLWC